MIQTEIDKLDSAFEEAIATAKTTRRPQLLSVTEPIDQIDPILFFENAGQVEGGRVFWKSADEDFWLAGAGEAYALEADSNRFTQIEEQWTDILSNAIIANSRRLPGTGPIAFGGFSFDPDKPKTSLWKDFQGSQFRVPAYLLSVINGECFFTINILVCDHDHSGQLAFQVEKTKQMLFSRAAVEHEGPEIERVKEIDPDIWKQLVGQTTDKIKNSDIEKIVLARELRVYFQDSVKLSAVLDKLVEAQTNSYVFAFENGKDCFLGASPERLVKVEERRLLSTCLAGTAPRGDTEGEDREIGYTLLHDQKNLHEHRFVVEMIREAVEACCRNVKVPDEPVLYPLKNLQHLYTPVEAELDSKFSILDVVKRLHPTPALGGKPRMQSMKFIREDEQLDRGWYGAPVGWMDPYQNGEFAVAIRSALIQESEASLFAGCGVVKDSLPEEEYEETNIKFTPMLSVLGGQSWITQKH
ncbi:isochorismate synthase [Sediminibacillus massiliensis]|uniref:isochorismate synthase n=1 Tax=Sediminibacillus massiliensis TaxID=1926277 RepID=UPI0009888C1E|nr:isochorismate synthase [Sediminibacillus massiliensis]